MTNFKFTFHEARQLLSVESDSRRFINDVAKIDVFPTHWESEVKKADSIVITARCRSRDIAYDTLDAVVRLAKEHLD